MNPMGIRRDYLDALAAWRQTPEANWPMTQLIWTGTATATEPGGRGPTWEDVLAQIAALKLALAGREEGGTPKMPPEHGARMPPRER